MPELLYEVGEIVRHLKAPEKGCGIITSINPRDKIAADIGDIASRYLPYVVTYDAVPEWHWNTAEENIILVASDRFKYCEGDIVRFKNSYSLYRIDELLIRNDEPSYYARLYVPGSGNKRMSFSGYITERDATEKIFERKFSVGDKVIHRLKPEWGVGVIKEAVYDHKDSDYIDYKKDCQSSDLYCSYRVSYKNYTVWWTHYLNLIPEQETRPKFSVGDMVIHIAHPKFGIGEVVEYQETLEAVDYISPDSDIFNTMSTPYRVRYIGDIEVSSNRWWTAEKNMKLVVPASKTRKKEAVKKAEQQEQEQKNYVRSILLRAILDLYGLP